MWLRFINHYFILRNYFIGFMITPGVVLSRSFYHTTWHIAEYWWWSPPVPLPPTPSFKVWIYKRGWSETAVVGMTQKTYGKDFHLYPPPLDGATITVVNNILFTLYKHAHFQTLIFILFLLNNGFFFEKTDLKKQLPVWKIRYIPSAKNLSVTASLSCGAMESLKLVSFFWMIGPTKCKSSSNASPLILKNLCRCFGSCTFQHTKLHTQRINFILFKFRKSMWMRISYSTRTWPVHPKNKGRQPPPIGIRYNVMPAYGNNTFTMIVTL